MHCEYCRCWMLGWSCRISEPARRYGRSNMGRGGSCSPSSKCFEDDKMCFEEEVHDGGGNDRGEKGDGKPSGERWAAGGISSTRTSSKLSHGVSTTSRFEAMSPSHVGQAARELQQGLVELCTTMICALAFYVMPATLLGCARLTNPDLVAVRVVFSLCEKRLCPFLLHSFGRSRDEHAGGLRRFCQCADTSVMGTEAVNLCCLCCLTCCPTGVILPAAPLR